LAHRLVYFRHYRGKTAYIRSHLGRNKSVSIARPLTPTVVYGYSYNAFGARPGLFVTVDIPALWRSGLSVRVPGCQQLQMTA